MMTRRDHGTSAGIRLTDEIVEKLAQEAERGYGADRLTRRRRRGRPPIGSKAATIFQVRLEPELRETLEARADALETTPSDIARRAMRAHLGIDSGAIGAQASKYGAVLEGEAGDRLRAVAAVLRGGAGALADLVEELGWSSQPESAAEFDLQVDAVCADGTPLPDSARGRIGDAVIGYTEATAGHLSSLAALFSVGEILYSVPLLVRGALEHALKVCWILEPLRDKDPARPVYLRDRLARVFLEELISTEHYKRTVGRLSSKSDEPYATVQRDWRLLRDKEIPRIFGREDVQLRERPYRIAQETLQGLEDLDEWYSRNHVPGVSRGVYDALSNFSHPTLFAVRELTKTVRTSDGAIRKRDLSVDFLERLTTVAISSFYKTLDHVFTYFGWPRDALDAWESAVNAWSPGLIQE